MFFLPFRLYLNGVNVDPMRLFPGCAPVFPVPPGTPMISPLIKLDHSQSWDVPKAEDFLGGGANNCVFEIEMGGDSEHNYLKGHKIDGRLLFPATGYLVMAWKALAKELKLNWLQMPVEFKDTSIQRATVLPSSGTYKALYCPPDIFFKEAHSHQYYTLLYLLLLRW